MRPHPPGTPLLLGILLVLAAQAARGQTPAFALEAQPLRGLQGPVAALLTTGTEGGSLPMAAVALPTGTGSSRSPAPMPFLVEIEGAGLLAAGSGDVRRLEVYAYATSPEGDVHGFLAQSLRLDLAAWGEALLAGGIKFAGTVDLPPGDGSLRILVLDPDTLRYGLRVLPVSQPAAGEGRPVLLPPLFPEPPGLWVLARPGAAVLAPVLAPLLVEGRSLPAALPVLAGGRTLRTVLLGRGLAEGPVALRLRDESGGAPVVVPLRVEERSAVPGNGFVRLVCSFELPRIKTGTWRIAASAGDLASPELTAAVLSESPAGREIAWSELRRLAGDQPSPPPPIAQGAPQGTGRRRNAERAEQVRKEYRDALQRLSTGSPLGEIAARLAQAEAAMAGQGTADPLGAVEDLREAEARAAERLGREEPESLLPVALLHAELYRALRDRREYLLAESSLRTAAALAERYARNAGTDLAGSLAARLLVRLAADLLVGGVETTSRDLLDRAQKLDPRSEAARLLLASHLEKSGEYARAADLLARLLEIHPESAEARLRLAVNLARSGRTAEARDGLRRLLATPGPQWIQEVAHQELVRLCLREGREKEAVALLREGLDRFPAQPQLAVQLAFLLDRQGSPAAAEVLSLVRPRTERAGSRHRYTLWPAAALEEVDHSLTQHALLRLPALARALAGGALRESR